VKVHRGENPNDVMYMPTRDYVYGQLSWLLIPKSHALVEDAIPAWPMHTAHKSLPHHAAAEDLAK